MSSDSKETPDKKSKIQKAKPNQIEKKQENKTKTPIPQYPQTKMEGQFNSGTM